MINSASIYNFKSLVFSKEKVLIFFLVLFFSIDFIRELMAFLNPNIINVLSIGFGLVAILLLNNGRVDNKLKYLYLSILFFLIISILNGLTKGFIDEYTVVYSFYKILELSMIFIIASNLSKNQILNFFQKFVKVFFILHTPIFFYYLLALIGIIPYHDRVVIFSYVRFGGLAGEPAQYGQMLLVVLFAMITLYRNNLISNFRLKLSVFMLFSFTSFSNAFFIPLAVFIIYYIFKKRKSLAKLFFYYIFGFVVIGSFFFINDRLSIDYEQLWLIITNFQQLGSVSIEGVGLNSVTTRFYEVLYALSNTNELIANGLGSGLNYSIFSGVLEEGQRINFYGISQVGYEVGLIPMFLLLFWLFKNTLFSEHDLFNKSALVSILFNMIFINGIAFKLYWFMLFILVLGNLDIKRIKT